jgi:hypothetical protein
MQVPGVEVGAGPHLVAAPSALEVLSVGQQVGGVEVHRLVSQPAQLVDLEHGVGVGQPGGQLGEALQRDEVLVVDARLQR